MRLCVIESSQVSPYANLALEKGLLDALPADTVVLYLWQNEHTVIIGKNQNAWRECRTKELERDGGHLARRLSGGGAVFHDLGNLNFTFLASQAHYDVEKQLAVILRAMHSLGLAAVKTGRNDLTIDGRKFSGNAFYSAGQSAYHHGTLLVDTDVDALSRYLSVDPLKLQAKGVSSVQARVVNLRDMLPTLTIPRLKEALITALGEVYGQQALPFDQSLLDQAELARLTQYYASWLWLYGAKLPFTHQLRTRFPWGGVEVQLAVSQGVIQQAAVYTDALDGELFALVASALTGARYQGSEVSQRLYALQTAENAAYLTELAQYLQDNI